VKRRVFIAATLAAATGPLAAQTYPSKPIRLIVPFPPGAYTDTVARVIADKLGQRVGQPVVVENRAGAGGNIGADYVAKATPDGYTLLVGTIANAISVSVYKKLPYDLQKDLLPVGLLATVPNVLVVNPELKPKTVAELIDFARANPGKLSYASSGNGGAPHLAGEMFKARTETDLVHVPYKGISPALTDVMGGQTTAMFASLDSAIGQVKAGKLQALAVTGSKRSPLLPQVPTMIESGLQDFEILGWAGILAPVGTPAAIIEMLNMHLVAIVNSAEVKTKFSDLGADAVSSTPGEFSKFIRSEIDKWSKVVKVAGVQTQ
jgi:tripartite-type tricarboxylate transporter receptor subunit TctC